MKPVGYVLSILIIAAAVVAGYLFIQRMNSPNGVDASAAQVFEQDLDIYAIGRLRPEGGVITVAAKPGERLESLNVKEGDVVRKGEPLGTLASSRLMEQRVRLLQAQLSAAKRKQSAEHKAAKAQLALATLGVKKAKAARDQELPMKQQQVKLLADNHDMEQQRLERLTAMHEENAELVNKAELQQQALATEKSRLTLEEARLALELAPALAERAIAEAEANEVLATTALEALEDNTALDALTAEIDVAQQQLEMSLLKSPIDGTVLRVFANPGEFVTQRPILQLADLENMVCVAEVYESAVKNLAVGQDVVITSPAFIEPYDYQAKDKDRGLRGEVVRIGKIVTEPGLKDLNPLAAGSKHVVQVVVKILNGDDEAYTDSSQLVDLQVRVRIKQKED